MSISARKVIKQSSGDRPLKMLIILLVLTGLLWVNSRPTQAANPGEDLPISIVDESYSVELLGEDQQNPTIVALSNKNKWLVVWEDWRNWNTSGADIYGRFIDKNGDYCGNEFIICNQFGNQTMPTLAYRPAGTVLVAWQDTRGTAASGFLYYSTIDVSLLAADGSSYLLSGETAAAYTSIGGDGLISRKLPKAAYDTARDLFWLVWVESRNSLQRIEEHAFGVSAARVTWRFGDTESIGYATIQGWEPTTHQTEIIRNGGAASNTSIRQLTHLTTKDEDTYTYEYFTGINNVTVACDELTAETLIAWEGIRGKATLTCTFEEHEAEFCVDDGEGNLTCETRPMVEGPSADDYFLSELELGTWEGDDDGQVHIYTLFDKLIKQTVVHSRRLDADGVAGHYPSAAFEPIHRKFLVTWEEQQDNGFSKVYGQLLFSGGGLYGPNRLLSFQDLDGDGLQDDNIANAHQTRPNIAVDLTNQLFLVTWQDGRNSQISQENLDIYGQFVDCEGSLRGNNYAINIATANQYGPRAAYNRGTHQFFMVWKDARNYNYTHADIYGQRFNLEHLQVFNNGLSATQIVLSDTGSNATFTPISLGFPTIQADQVVVRNITVRNTSSQTLMVKEVGMMMGENFMVNGLTVNDEIASQESLTFPVTFSPRHTGNFDDTLTVVFGPLEEEEGSTIPCYVLVNGTSAGDVFYEVESFTADRNYPLKINAFTDQPGQLYVLLTHVPVSGGTVYAVTPGGNIVPFPYGSSFDWQNLYYATSASPTMEVNLSNVDLRQIGCTACQGPSTPGTHNGYLFGTIPINPPVDESYNSACDFKYLEGDLYLATFLADGVAGTPFNFNLGLLELQQLNINSFGGNWQVTSSYDGQGREHADLLQVQEENGNISAQWGQYSPIDISYDETDSAYRIEFSLGAYHYTYMIDQLTADNFTGYYHCEYDGTVVVDQAPVSGIRVQ